MKIGRRIPKGIASTPKPTIPTLIGMRQQAIRKGIWFRALTSMQRGIVNLTIRCIKEIKSSLLGRTLQNIFAVLSQAIEQGYLYRFFAAGKDLAEHLSNAAYSWGNRDALKWRFDKAYIICLGMSKLSGWSYQ